MTTFMTYKEECEHLRQRVAELENERDEWCGKHDVACLTITSLQSKYECQLSATSKAMQGVAELTAERDELLAAATKAAEEIRKCDYTPARSTLLVAIASVKEKQK